MATSGVIISRVRTRPGWGPTTSEHLTTYVKKEENATVELTVTLDTSRIALGDVAECETNTVDSWNGHSKIIEDKTESTNSAYKAFAFKDLKAFAKCR